ncbi:hypothetical protein ACFL6I_00450 [candidate division KSB1 bacterium]
MIHLDKLRSRYLQDTIPTRIGGLAANLARMASFSKHDDHQKVVTATIQESKWFIEWTAGELSIDETAELIILQSQLARWELQSHKEWKNMQWRQELERNSRQWSERLLRMSGLLNQS